MSKNPTTDPVTEAAKRVAALSEKIAETEAQRAELSTELRALRAAKKAAEADHRNARAVALLALADDPQRFAEAAESLRESIAKTAAESADPAPDPEPVHAVEPVHSDAGVGYPDNANGGDFNG